jgi:uncharacterized protein YndB with AHSA1/START domain
MDTDRIEREIVVEAPVERVWAALTEARHIGTWFGDAGAEVDLRVGGALTISWAEHGTAVGRIEAIEPMRRFAWWWGSDAGVEPSAGKRTLVEFLLEPDGPHTTLRVVESGFTTLDLPANDLAARYADHTTGWEAQLRNVRDHVARQPA